MIRYRTRDLTRLLPGTARTMRRMEKITGRSDDMMIVRGVNVFPTQIEEQILKVKGLAPALPDRADARGPPGRDGGAGGGCARSAAEPTRAQASAAELGHHIKGLIGVTAQDHRHRSRRRRAQPGQGPPRDRQAAERLGLLPLEGEGR